MLLKHWYQTRAVIQTLAASTVTADVSLEQFAGMKVVSYRNGFSRPRFRKIAARVSGDNTKIRLR